MLKFEMHHYCPVFFFLQIVIVQSLSMSGSFETPWTVAWHAPLSMGFHGQGYWSGLPFPLPGNLPNPGIEPESPAFQTGSLPLRLGKHKDREGNFLPQSHNDRQYPGTQVSEFQSNILVNNPSFFLTLSSNQILTLLYISRYMQMYIGI